MTNSGGANAIDKKFPASAPWLIQEANLQSDSLKK
jgi:hypothetical protein